MAPDQVKSSRVATTNQAQEEDPIQSSKGRSSSDEKN
jgi:hypothetical protein